MIRELERAWGESGAEVGGRVEAVAFDRYVW